MTDDPKPTQRAPFTGFPSSSLLPRAEEWADEAATRDTDASIAVPPATPRQLHTRAVVTIVSGPGTGEVHSIFGELVVGRGREAHLRLDDGGTSRAHARIKDEGGRYVLEDLGSLNGTFVDGQRVTRVELQSGDRIHVGPNVVMAFAVLDAQAERLAHQLYESSVRDPLTRAHNRRYLVERLESEIAYANRHASALGLILFDIDHFKQVNDAHGHLAGDEVLREISSLVQRMIRTEDVFARYGGEEFVLLVRGIVHVNLGRFAERLRAAVERLEIAGAEALVRVTISAGYATLGELADAARTPDELLRLADERLYRSKEAGRNRVTGA